ncbi:MAG: SDR family NAD(P)-dependent oxidoreductase [Ilumatobacter sp.]
MIAPIGADLAGKVAFVTGGGTGIGGAVAARLAERGAHVAVVGRRPEPLEVVAHAAGAMAVTCDVSDSAAVDDAVASVVERFGGLDIVVNNAGIAGRAGVAELDDDGWQAMIDINLTGPARVARAATPHLRERGGGSIINVASVGALFAAKQSVAYSTTKAGLLGLTRSMAVDLGPDGIRVNTLCPGWVDTPMAGKASAAASRLHSVDDDASRQLLVANNPIARMADPDEIAACIEFFASDASSFVTGAMLIADGGQTIVDVGTLPLARPRS